MRGITIIATLALAMLSNPSTAGVFAGAVLAQQCFSQTGESDPFLEQVNAELDRREGETPAPEAASMPGNEGGGLQYLRVVSALSLVLALILGVLYAVRRFLVRTPLLAASELGRVLGRLYLSRNATLYFIETGGKVLLIGVTGQSVATLGQFDASAYTNADAEESGAFNSSAFLSQLESSSRTMRPTTVARDDDEMLSLRRDIERLQDFLREESREPRN